MLPGHRGGRAVPGGDLCHVGGFLHPAAPPRRFVGHEVGWRRPSHRIWLQSAGFQCCHKDRAGADLPQLVHY